MLKHWNEAECSSLFVFGFKTLPGCSTKDIECKDSCVLHILHTHKESSLALKKWKTLHKHKENSNIELHSLVFAICLDETNGEEKWKGNGKKLLSFQEMNTDWNDIITVFW